MKKKRSNRETRKLYEQRCRDERRARKRAKSGNSVFVYEAEKAACALNEAKEAKEKVDKIYGERSRERAKESRASK